MKYLLILDIHNHVHYEEFESREALDAKVKMLLDQAKESYPHYQFTPVIYKAEREGGA